MFNIVETL